MVALGSGGVSHERGTLVAFRLERTKRLFRGAVSSQVDILGVLYKFVNFGAEQSPGAPNWEKGLKVNRDKRLKVNTDKSLRVNLSQGQHGVAPQAALNRL